MFFATVFATAAALSQFPQLSDGDRERLLDIRAPRVVASLPGQEAAYTLCRLADGEFRFYGLQMIGGVQRKAFLRSRNYGLDWKLELAGPDDMQSPMIYIAERGVSVGVDRDTRKGPFYCLRLEDGAKRPKRINIPFGLGNFTSIRKLRTRDRLLVPCTASVSGRTGMHAGVALSDDFGLTWRQSMAVPNVSTGAAPSGRDALPRWDNYCCEPSVVELSDGTLWMVVRTSFDHPYSYISRDGGDSWEGPSEMSAFWQSNTMPDMIRLADGRLLFLWNNTQSMPRLGAEALSELRKWEKDSRCEAAFTNRDVLHAAISEDEGRTWIGFREFALNPLRNATDFRRAQAAPFSFMLDKSVHQSQAMELGGGKVLVAAGQHDALARMYIFDVAWLYEKGRFEDFGSGLDNVTHHLFVKSLQGSSARGRVGHCALNRMPGVVMARPPDTEESTRREAAWLVKTDDPRVIWNNPGLAWNFPAARRGSLEIACRVEGEGFRLGLADHWINPSDPFAEESCVVSAQMVPGKVGAGWTVVVVSWDCDAGKATVKCATGAEETLSMRFVPEYGPSYLHIQTLAKGLDLRGTYFKSFKMEPW